MLRVVECDHFLYHPSSSLDHDESRLCDGRRAHRRGGEGNWRFKRSNSIGFIDRSSQNLIASEEDRSMIGGDLLTTSIPLTIRREKKKQERLGRLGQFRLAPSRA